MKSNQRTLTDGRVITLKLGKKYGSVTGRRFQAVEIYHNDTLVKRVDVVVRANANDGLENRAGVIYGQALRQLGLEVA